MKLKNFTWRENEVKALDSSKPSLRTATRVEFKSDAAQWTNRFRNEDGSLWVNDGKTLPVAFGSNFSITINYSVGVTIYTFNHLIIDKQTFLEVAKDISGGIFIQSGATDDWGMDVMYGGSTLYVNFNVFEDFTDVAYNSFVNNTEGFTLTRNTYTEEVVDSGTAGAETNTPIVPEIVNGDSYSEVVSSILEEPLRINGIEVYSTDACQLMSPISFKQYDVNGNETVIPSTPILNPYQSQLIVKYKYDLDFDGQTVVSAQVNGDRETLITFDYKDKARFEKKTQLEGEGLLHHQRDAINAHDREVYETRYANFSGFGDNRNEITKVLIVGLIAYILIKEQ